MKDESTSPLPAELFQQVKAIQIRTRRLVTDLLAGEYASVFRGQGMEFEDVREYRPGDDIRRIDWNVTARSGRPFVKEHKEERELTIVIAVDVSASGAFGSCEKRKREIAAEIAAVLAFLALASNDNVGLIIFSDEVEHFIPPKKGRAHLWRVVRDILAFAPARRGTSIKTALEFLGRVIRRRAVVFLVSDFLDAGYERALAIAARRHDLTALAVTDPRELVLPEVGLVELEDLETGQRILVDTSDRGAMAELERLARGRRERLTETLRAAGAGEIPVSTDAPYTQPIIRYLRARERARAH